MIAVVSAKYPFWFEQAKLSKTRRYETYSMSFSFGNGTEVSFALHIAEKYFELIDYLHSGSKITLWVAELHNVEKFIPYTGPMPWSPKLKWEKVIESEMAALADPFYPKVKHPRIDRECWVLKRRHHHARHRIPSVQR